jgi:clusterin-associated protein 1
MLTKARVKLNIRRLYAADGQAVRELLKLARLLRRATQSAEQAEEVGPLLRPAAVQRSASCAYLMRPACS